MNIFIAFTPYHALLSYSVALSLKQSRNVLFIVNEFPETEVLSKALRNSSFEVFSDVLCLPGTYKSPEKATIEKLLKRKRNIIFLKSIIKSHQVENVFTGNDMRAEAQSALHYAKSMYPDCKGTYLEDGTAAYESHIAKKRGIISTFLCKIFFGLWWQDRNVFGVSSNIDTCQLLFPELARKELKIKKIININKEDFLKMSSDKALQDYFNYFNFDTKIFKKIDVLLIGLFSHFEKDYPHLKEIMEEILQNTESRKLQLAIKYHPRELSVDFLTNKNKKDIIILPQAIPLELFYVFYPDPPKLIIGGHSTALLTARWIFPEAKIISVLPLLDYDDQNLFETFKKSNMNFVYSVQDIKNQLWNIEKNS